MSLPDKHGPDTLSSTDGWVPDWLDAAERDPETVQIGRYVLGPQLGAGGMGVVYEAWDPQLKRAVALKMLYRDSPDALWRFTQEASFQARVSHPNICPVHEVDGADTQLILVMQLVNGPSLEQIGRNLPPKELAGILEAVARAVHAAHLQGVIHRDLKPSNILLEPGRAGWHPFVADFGLAKDLQEPFTTHSRIGLGTPGFAAPEQAAGLGADGRSDVYSLGGILYWCLSGCEPSGAWRLRERGRLGGWEPPHRLWTLAPHVPRDLEELVARCLAFDPDERYPDAESLAEALGRFLRGEPLSFPPWPDRVARFLRRRKREMAIGLLGALLPIAAVVWGVLRLKARDEAFTQVLQVVGEAEQVEGAVQALFRQPPHDLEPALAGLRTQAGHLAERLPALREGARAAGQLALGRMFLAMGDLEPANHHLQAAYRMGERSPQLARSLGQGLAQTFEWELEAARLSGGPSERLAKEERLRRHYLAPIERLVVEALAIGDAPFLRALLAQVKGNGVEARRLLQDVLTQHPGRLDALRLRGECGLGEVRRLKRAGSGEAAIRLLADVHGELVQARSVVPADPYLACLESDTRHFEGLIRLESGKFGAGRAAFRQALESAQGALDLQGSFLPARQRLTRALYFLGQAGDQPVRRFQEAEASARAWLMARPQAAEGHRILGRILLARAEQPGEGQSVTRLEEALDHLRRASEGGHPAEEALVHGLLLRAQALRFRGEDPGPSLAEALRRAEDAHRTWGDEPSLFALDEALAAQVAVEQVRGGTGEPWLGRLQSLRASGMQRGVRR